MLVVVDADQAVASLSGKVGHQRRLPARRRALEEDRVLSARRREWGAAAWKMSADG